MLIAHDQQPNKWQTTAENTYNFFFYIGYTMRIKKSVASGDRSEDKKKYVFFESSNSTTL